MCVCVTAIMSFSWQFFFCTSVSLYMSTTGDEQSESVTDRHTDGRTDRQSQSGQFTAYTITAIQTVIDPDRANRGSGPAETDLHQSCPWVGLTHGLGWVHYSNSVLFSARTALWIVGTGMFTLCLEHFFFLNEIMTLFLICVTTVKNMLGWQKNTR